MRRDYRALIIDLLDQLRPIRTRVASGALSSGDRELIMRKAHQFTGSGASYGFPGLTESGRALEYYLVDYPKAEPTDIIPFVDAFLRSCENTALDIKAERDSI